jgi:DNA-binding response OmpR family regulator
MAGSILVVEADVGFLFWLGELLDRAGYQAFPAQNIREANALLRDLHLSVSLLILDCSLPDAEDFISTVRYSHRSVKTICLCGGRSNHIRVDGPCLDRSEVRDESTAVWLRKIRNLLPVDGLAV